MATLTWKDNEFTYSGANGYLAVSYTSPSYPSMQLKANTAIYANSSSSYIGGSINSTSRGVSINSISRSTSFNSSSVSEAAGIYSTSSLSLPSASLMAGRVIFARYYGGNMSVSGSVYRVGSSRATSSFTTKVGTILFSDGARWYAFEGNS